MENRAYPTHPRTGVGAVVFNDDKILLVKRKSEPRASHWTLPGGLVEIGETVHEAVVREVCEECGLTIEPTGIVDVVDFIERDDKGQVRYHYVLIDFEAQYVSGDPTPASDISDVGWFSRAEAGRLKLPAVTQRFLSKHYGITG